MPKQSTPEKRGLTVLLIRHGETDWVGRRLAGRLPDIHLNERGHGQAARLAECLAAAPLRAVYTSPLDRARETAAPIAAGAGLQPRVCAQLEEGDFGELTGKSFEELRPLAIWKLAHRSPSQARFPGGESLIEIQDRTIRAVAEIRAEHPQEGAVVAVVSHADPIRLLLAGMLEMPFDAFHRLVIDTASVSVLRFTGETVRLLGMNLPPEGVCMAPPRN